MSVDQLANEVIDRAADAAVPDPPPGSGAAAALPLAPPVLAPTASARSGGPEVEVDDLAPSRSGDGPWGGSRRWTDARVVPMAPTAVATAWLAALARGDWTTAWSTTDANLRLALAQQWLDGLGRRGDNVSAWSLAAEVPHVGMWAPFADHLFGRWVRELDLPPSRSGDGRWVSRPSDHHQFGRDQFGRDLRPGAGRELCVLRMGPDASSGDLTLRLRDRWRLAGIGRGVMQPGWPARWIALVDGADDVDVAE